MISSASTVPRHEIEADHMARGKGAAALKHLKRMQRHAKAEQLLSEFLRRHHFKDLKDKKAPRGREREGYGHFMDGYSLYDFHSLVWGEP